MSRRAVQIGVLLVAVLIGAGLLTAQDTKPSDTPPVMSELNKLKVQTLSQAMEIDQLHAQQAQSSFDQHKKELQTLVSALALPGYDINSQLEYVAQKPSGAVKP